MTRQRLLNLLALWALMVTSLHAIAIRYDLYWNLPGYDKLVHISGGMFIALLLFWLCFLSGYVSVRMPKPFSFFLLIVGGTLIVGIGWEVFENALGQGGGIGGYWFDTITDVLADIIGGLAGYWYLCRLRSKQSATESLL